MMSLIEDVKAAWNEKGFRYVIKRAPIHFCRVCRKHIISKIVHYLSIYRNELQSYCSENGDLWYYSQEETFEIVPPVTSEPPNEFQQLLGNQSCAPNFVGEAADISMIGPYGICMTTNGRLIIETMGTETVLTNRICKTFDENGTLSTILLFIKKLLLFKKEYNYDLAVSLIPRHGRSVKHVNFAHWMLENLPQIRAIEYYRDTTGEKPLLLVNPNPPTWMKESLERLGYSSDDWKEWDGESATIRNLVIPQLNYLHNIGSQPSPTDKRWIRERMKESVSEPSDKFSKRIFISRQNAERRRISNFEEVMQALRPLGFESYLLENLTIEEEISLFSQAEMIIGVHGAGLATAIYSECSTLIEIFPEDVIATCYFILANEMGLKYDYLVGESTTEGQTANPKNKDIKINPDRLTNMVREIGI